MITEERVGYALITFTVLCWLAVVLTGIMAPLVYTGVVK